MARQVNRKHLCRGHPLSIHLNSFADNSAIMADGAAADMASLSVESPVAERMPYYKKRVDDFEQFYARELAKLDAAKAANVPIKVIMPDGKERPAVKGVTTPMDIAKEISAGLAKKVVVADVDGQSWDLVRPLEGDCSLKLFSFDDAEGRDVSI
jgi:threonyl-tRNA synthetase